MDVFAGRCYCGNIRFEVRTRPETETLALFCHCESCRRAHAAPLFAVVYIPSIDLKIVEGEEPEVLSRPKLFVRIRQMV